MNRKKVAVLLPWLKMGGTNKIALNFMKELSQYCDVTLILSENSGELFHEMPENLELVFDEMDEFRDIVYKDLKSLKLGFFLKDCIYYAKIKLGKDSVDNYKYLVDRHGYITDEEYDCVISYHGQSPERLLNLLYRIHTKRKVVWIHGEMSFPMEKIDLLKKYYAKVDHFFFVSNPTMESFVRLYPFARNKSTVYYNPIDRKDIMEKAKQSFNPEFSVDCINLLTVGRLSKEKGQDMIPAVTKVLLDQGLHVCWYLIGDGDLRGRINDLIRDNQVENHVILLGTQINPYCYMRACDIYVQPSYTEGYSTTICEAGMLGKAIIGTKPSGGIRDQITDGVDGLIVDATIEGLTEGIKMLIADQGMRFEFGERISKKNFEGTGEINKFLNYLDEEL